MKRVIMTIKDICKAESILKTDLEQFETTNTSPIEPFLELSLDEDTIAKIETALGASMAELKDKALEPYIKL